MQAENQYSWSLEVRAKSRSFDFKFNTTKLSPTWKLHRLSLLLKIRGFFLRVNSDPASSIFSPPKHETFKSKLRRILNKLRSKSTKKSPNRLKPEDESAPNRLQQYTKEEKKFGLGKSSKLLVLSIAKIIIITTAFFCSLVFDFSHYYMKYIKSYASQYVWLAWKFLASLIWDTLRS